MSYYLISKGGYTLVFKAISPTLQGDTTHSLELILTYTEELRRETEAKLSALDRTLEIIKEQIKEIKEAVS